MQFDIASLFHINVVTALVACATFFVGYRSYRVSADKLKLDLYDRRWAIYKAALASYRSEYLADDQSKEIEDNLILAVRESQFLFDPRDGVYDALEDIRNDLRIVRVNLASFTGAQVKEEVAADKLHAPTRIEANLKLLECRMSPYLAFQRRGSDAIWLSDRR